MHRLELSVVMVQTEEGAEWKKDTNSRIRKVDQKSLTVCVGSFGSSTVSKPTFTKHG